MPETPIRNPRQNRILASLPVAEYARLADDLEFVTFKPGERLYDAGDILEFVHFPTTCIISLVLSTANGASAELGMSGNDGVTGIALVLGGETTTCALAVQCAGGAYRLPAEVMRWELDQAGSLRRLCLGYTQALMSQMAQSVLCNRHHTVEQQLCRWLLCSLDLLPGNKLDVTHESIARMLGVRREAVTEAAGRVQAAGLIEYHRGHITVTDRPGLEARSCECYGVVKGEHDRLSALMPAPLFRQRVRPNPVTLRKRAEARLRQATSSVPSTSWDTERLVHELRVHQIELEMHNEELREAYDEADALQRECADIYDFAPLGYFTLDPHGVILNLNLAGAIMLGIKRSQHARHRFGAFVKPEFLPAFNRFLEEVLDAKSKKKCDVVLLASSHRPETTVRIEAVADESGCECRMVVSDVTAERQPVNILQTRE